MMQRETDITRNEMKKGGRKMQFCTLQQNFFQEGSVDCEVLCSVTKKKEVCVRERQREWNGQNSSENKTEKLPSLDD